MSENIDGELLSAYIDGEVEGEELNRVNTLLASSAGARQELERLQETKVSLAAAPRMPAPPDLVALLLANPKLHEKTKKAWWAAFIPHGMPTWAFASASAAVIALATVVSLKAPWTAKPLPLEPFLAAHARQQMEGGLHGRVIAAADYSGLLASQNETHS